MTSEGHHKPPAADQAQSTTGNQAWIETTLKRLGAWLPYSANCFRCGSIDLQRSSRRNWFEYVLGIALLPYRCQRCDLRLFKSHWLKIKTK